MLATLWLALVLPVSAMIRPSYQDFAAFYMGGLLASRGQWNLLYPVPDPTSPYYVGVHGTFKPEHQALADERGVQALCPFLQPPWNAIAFIPLGVLPFRVAHGIWWALLAIGVLAGAWASGRAYELCLGRRSRAAGVIMLATVCSPLIYRSIRVSNVSPLVAGCVGVALLSMLDPWRGRGFLGAISIWLAGVLKYASVALVPVLLAARQWKMFAWLSVLGVITIVVTLAVAGRETFSEFFTAVGANLAGSALNRGNQSIYGMLLRIRGEGPLPQTSITVVRTVQFVALAIVAALTLLVPKQAWKRPPVIFAGATAWLAWLLIFAPLFWEHYQMYFVPLWGWMIWEARRSRIAAGVVVLILIMAALPLQVLPGLTIPEPLNSYLLLATGLMFALALWRLANARIAEESPQDQMSG